MKKPAIEPITDLQAEYAKEVKAPFTDALTGLFNHGYFLLSLEREINRNERFGTSFSVALLDIDHFAEFNKHHGTLEGDKLLKQVAAIIKNNIRNVDLSARLGDDLFAMLLIESANKHMAPMFERITKEINKISDGEITASIGITFFPGIALNKEELLRAANDQLLQAKNGICRICFDDEHDPALSWETKPKILVVDDEERNVRLLEALLVPLGYKIFKAYGGKEALKLVNKTDVDLILLDIMMPEVNGFEVCQTLKSREHTRMIPIIMVTALDEIESKIKGIEAGADDFLTKPPNKMELLARTRSLLKNKRLNDKLTSIETVLCSLANVVEAKDAYTQGHVQRVANISITLGKKLGVSGKELEALKLGGILHDIGKIAIPKAILNKPGPLDDEEWKLMMTHASVGYKVCLPLKKTLGLALDVIRHHHEKLDGSGYPDGIMGEEISTVARIMAAVDIYDAMTTDRPYRRALSQETALNTLQDEVAKGRLDKDVVDTLAYMITRD